MAVKMIFRSAIVPLGRVQQSQDSQGKFINLARFGQFADDEHIKSILESIQRYGQFEPCCVKVTGFEGELPQSQEALDIIIESNPNLMFTLITGNNRYKACQIGKIKTLVVNIVEGSAGEMVSVSIAENISKHLSPMDRAMAYYRLTMPLEMGGADLNARSIGNRHNESVTTVTNYLTLLKLPREMQNALHDSDQKIGRWAKADQEDWNPLKMTKALSLLKEARAYAATLLNKDEDPEGFDNHVKQALGSVWMQFENGYTPDNGMKIPKGFWRTEAIWPEGSRPKEQNPPPPPPPPPPSDGKGEDDGKGNGSGSGSPPPPPPSPKPGTGKDKPERPEKFGLGMSIAFIKGVRRTLVTEMGIPAAAEVPRTLEAVTLLLEKLEKVNVGSDEADRCEGEFTLAVKRLADEGEKTCDELRKTIATLSALEKAAKG